MSLWLNRLKKLAVVANYYRGLTRLLSANRLLALITALFYFVGVSLGMFETFSVVGQYADCTFACCFASSCDRGLWVHRLLQQSSMDTCDTCGSVEAYHCLFLLLLPV